MTDEKCPWDNCPKTLEGLLTATIEQELWEEEHGQPAPFHWNIMLTKNVFGDLISRLFALEERLKERP